jgi:hypothetical protein
MVPDAPRSEGASRCVTGCHAFLVHGLDEPLPEEETMKMLTDKQASPVFGLRYLEDREVEGLDVVGCLIAEPREEVVVTPTATGCDDSD